VRSHPRDTRFIHINKHKIRIPLRQKRACNIPASAPNLGERVSRQASQRYLCGILVCVWAVLVCVWAVLVCVWAVLVCVWAVLVCVWAVLVCVGAVLVCVGAVLVCVWAVLVRSVVLLV